MALCYDVILVSRFSYFRSCCLEHEFSNCLLDNQRDVGKFQCFLFNGQIANHQKIN